VENSDSQSLRGKIISQCRALSPSQREQLSIKAAQRFLSQLEKNDIKLKGLNIALYRAGEDEVDLKHLENECVTQNSLLYYPRVVSKTEMKFHLVENPGNYSWVKNKWGIEEPAESAASLPPQQLDMIIVPGVAFTSEGKRMGRGAGFYDRFLPHTNQALKVSLCFEFQIVKVLQQNQWDVDVDWIFNGVDDFLPGVECKKRESIIAKLKR